MAVESGFFYSENGDRVYGPDDFNTIFEGLITDGIYHLVGGAFRTMQAGEMAVIVDTGRAWLLNKWVRNTSAVKLAIEPSDVVLNRYDSIVIRVDDTDPVRSGGIYVKKGVPATEATPPELENTENIKEIVIANIYVAKNANVITQSQITDMRGSKNCPWVTGLINQVSTGDLWAQFLSQWNDFMSKKEKETNEWSDGQKGHFLDWFEGIKAYMDSDIEAKITKDIIDLKERDNKSVITLPAGGWQYVNSGSYTPKYVQEVAVNGVREDNVIFITPAEGSEESYYKNNIYAVSQGNNEITFQSDNAISSDIMISVVVLGI